METLVKMKFGSHLYGTSTPASDLDFKGVYLPSAESIILQRVKGSISNSKSDKAEGEKNKPGDIDEEMYSLQNYLYLLADGQTGPLDMLFAPDSVIIEKTCIWDAIRANRAKFLTKKSAAFVGYCRTQANKYGVKGSRVAAARLATEKFAFLMEKYGTQARLEELVPAMEEILGEHTKFVEQVESHDGKKGMFFECCNRKVNFHNTVKHAYEVYSRIYENYGARARMAENNEGIDWKALSHAVRVGYEALELLKTGNITLPLPNAPHILEIKQGKLSYKEVAEEIENLLFAVEAAAVTSTLPDKIDYKFIDELVREAYLGVVIRTYV